MRCLASIVYCSTVLARLPMIFADFFEMRLKRTSWQLRGVKI